MNWRRHWFTVVIFAVGLAIAIALGIHAAAKQPKKIEYFYVSKGPVFHLDPKCQKGLVFIKAAEVFQAYYPDQCFCSSCISQAELEQIHDSVEVCHSIVTLVKNE